MGYRKQKTIYKLRFEAYPGLEVSATSVDTRSFLMVVKAKEVSDTETLFQAFAAALDSWNLEDEDGTPVPATLDGLLSQDFTFVTEIIGAWTEAIAGVSAPLETPSSDGEPSPVLSLPMEPLSLSQAN